MYSNTTASNNTAVGYQALYAYNGSTGYNTSLGTASGVGTTSGNYNTFLGASAGNGITTGSNNIYIGYNAYQSSASVSTEIVLGYNVGGKGANTAFIGGSSGAYNGANSAAWSITSDQRLKKNIVDNNIGLEKIIAIQVRNFEYRLPEEVDAELKPTDAIKKSGVQLGAIAQELQQVLPECVKTESTGVMTVDTDNLTWYLVNAVKELSKQVKQLQSQLKGKS